MRKNFEVLVDRIKELGVKVVSFDLYDTLVRRTVEDSRDIFALAALVASHRRPDADFSRFVALRQVAPRRAHEVESAQEVTLDQIYQAITEYSTEDKELLRQCEVTLEEALLVPVDEMVEQLRRLRERGMSCVITSDMYLPRASIERILKRFGVRHDGLFLSSDIGLTKRSGDLFGVVCSTMGIRPGEILHLGDDVRADFVVPCRLGIHAQLVRQGRMPRLRGTRVRLLRHGQARRASESMAAALMRLRPSNAVNAQRQGAAFMFGYRLLGPLLCGFAVWLHRGLRATGLARAFFLARDGGLILRVHERLFGPSKEMRYLRVSRRACALPFAWEDEGMADVIARMPLRHTFTLRTLLEMLGFDSHEAQAAARANEMSLDEPMTKSDAVSKAAVRDMIAMMGNTLAERSRLQRQLLVEYLVDAGVNGDVAVVDVGWNGTLQQELMRVIAANEGGIAETRLTGYYIGINRSMPAMRGYLFEEARSSVSLRLKAAQGLFEHFFLAQEGSVLRYGRDSAGDVVAVLDEGHENAQGRFVAREVQDGALCFADYVASCGLLDAMVCCSPTDLAAPLLRDISRPTAEALRTFGNISYFDSRELWLSESRGLSHYLAHPHDLVGDFYDAGWKTGFLRETFRLPIDYGQLYAWLARMRGALR